VRPVLAVRNRGLEADHLPAPPGVPARRRHPARTYRNGAAPAQLDHRGGPARGLAPPRAPPGRSARVVAAERSGGEQLSRAEVVSCDICGRNLGAATEMAGVRGFYLDFGQWGLRDVCEDCQHTTTLAALVAIHERGAMPPAAYAAPSRTRRAEAPRPRAAAAPPPRPPAGATARGVSRAPAVGRRRRGKAAPSGS
jgi:hypothetical protein